ncbi:MAG: hypothetical protein R2911_18740 [Caldilineaceae bacterium]
MPKPNIWPAVADAYVASGEDANALILAQRRLQGLDLAIDIPNAVAYFQQSMQGDPVQTVDVYQQGMQIDGNIRISYLMRMASGLGVNTQAPAAAVDVAASTSSEEGDVAVPPSWR